MKITILCVGKIKETFYRDAAAEYTKRLSRYCKLEIVEVADEKTPEDAGVATVRVILEKEGERLKKHLKDDAFVCALAIDGKQMDSVEFAAKMEAIGMGGGSHIIFLIGGSLGLCDDLRKRADINLSFSAMTFPHQLMRVILLEQIYRSYRIIHHEPYHK